MASEPDLSFTVRQITTPTETDIENATNVLAAAFEKDDCTAIFIGRDPKMFIPFQRMKVTAGFMAGEVYVAEDAKGNFIGVAIWFPPGREMFDTYELVNDGFANLLPIFCVSARISSL